MADPLPEPSGGTNQPDLSTLIRYLEDNKRRENANSSANATRDIQPRGDGPSTVQNTITTPATPTDMPNRAPNRETDNGMPFHNLTWNDFSSPSSRDSSSLSKSSGYLSPQPGLTNGFDFQDPGLALQPSLPLPNRKRQRDDYSPSLRPGESPDRKSRKPTPVGVPVAAAPSSSSSRPPSRRSDNNPRGVGELLGLSDDEFSDMQREQLEMERQLEERREQEHRDAEFARFLLEDEGRSRAISSSPDPSVSTLASLPPAPGPSTASVAHAGPSQQHHGAPMTESRNAASTVRPIHSQPVTDPFSSRSNQGYIDISSDSDIEEIQPSDFPTAKRHPAQATSSWNKHQAAIIDGRSWPTVDSSYSDVRHDDRILGPAGPRTLESQPLGDYPIPYTRNPFYDRAALWMKEATMMGTSMPGAFPMDDLDQYASTSVGIGLPRPGYEILPPSLWLTRHFF